MTFARPWLGRKRVAFVPLFRSNAAPPIRSRPIGRTSSCAGSSTTRGSRPRARTVRCARGCAPPRRAGRHRPGGAADADHRPAGRRGRRARGHARRPSARSGHGRRRARDARRPGAGTNGGFWSRVVMAESNGVWLMELIHGLTGFKDLYHFDNDVDPPERAIDTFDEMSASSQTHPTAFTKNELGWLDAAAIRRARRRVRRVRAAAHQPCPAAGGRGGRPPSASATSFPYLMVEARKMTDQFEAGMPSYRRRSGVRASPARASSPTASRPATRPCRSGRATRSRSS